MGILEEMVQINRYTYNKYYEAFKIVERRDKDYFNKDLLEKIEMLNNRIEKLKNRNLIQRILNL